MDLSMIGVSGPVTERNFNTTGGPEWGRAGTIMSRMTTPVKPRVQIFGV